MSQEPKKLNRRLFLMLVALTGTTTWLMRRPLDQFRLHLLHGPAHPFVSLIKNPETAIAAGDAYLEAYPAEADPNALPVAILPNFLGSFNAETLRKAFTQQVAADFAEGRLVELNGWVLARTEARLFALCALWLRQ